MPTMRGRNQVEHASGTIPILPKTKPIAGLRRRHPHVHGQGHRRADADRRTVDRGDHRLGARVDRQRDPAAGVADAVQDRRVVEPVLHVRQRRLLRPRRARTRCRPPTGPCRRRRRGRDRSRRPPGRRRRRWRASNASTSSSAISTVNALSWSGRSRVSVRMPSSTRRRRGCRTPSLRQGLIPHRRAEVVAHLVGVVRGDQLEEGWCAARGSQWTARSRSAPRR